MKHSIKILVFLISLFSVSSALADGRCVARDPSDSFSSSTCSNKSEQLCRWDENCRYTESSSGSCEARDSSDSFSRNTCPNKSEQICKWDQNCVWNQ